MAISIYSDQSRQANWFVRKKTDVSLSITVTQNSSAYDLSSTVFIAEFFQVNGIVPFLTLTQGSGITNGGASGIVTLALTDAQLDIIPNQYFWKLRTTSPTDYLWLNGVFQVNDYVWDGDGNSSLAVALTVGNNNIDLALTLAGSSTLSSLGTLLQTAAADTPLDADTWNFYDAVDAVLKKITWANIKATLKTYFDGLYKLLITTSSALTDAATIDITAAHHTLTTASSRTFTKSYTGDSVKMAITLNATSATFTIPTGEKVIYGGTASGTNTLVVTGATSGDIIVVAIEKVGSVNIWVGRNSIR